MDRHIWEKESGALVPKDLVHGLAQERRERENAPWTYLRGLAYVLRGSACFSDSTTGHLEQSDDDDATPVPPDPPLSESDYVPSPSSTHSGGSEDAQMLDVYASPVSHDFGPEGSEYVPTPSTAHSGFDDLLDDRPSLAESNPTPSTATAHSVEAEEPPLLLDDARQSLYSLGSFDDFTLGTFTCKGYKTKLFSVNLVHRTRDTEITEVTYLFFKDNTLQFNFDAQHSDVGIERCELSKCRLATSLSINAHFHLLEFKKDGLPVDLRPRTYHLTHFACGGREGCREGTVRGHLSAVTRTTFGRLHELLDVPYKPSLASAGQDLVAVQIRLEDRLPTERGHASTARRLKRPGKGGD